MAAKKRKKKSPEIDIKLRNLDNCCGAKTYGTKKTSWCYAQCNGGHFWMFGSALAMILSYERSASILWAILHGILSWFYVIFRGIQSLG